MSELDMIEATLRRMGKVYAAATQVAMYGVVEAMLEDGVKGWQTTTLDRVQTVIEREWVRLQALVTDPGFTRRDYSTVRTRVMELLVNNVMSIASDTLSEFDWCAPHGVEAVEEFLDDANWGEPLEGISQADWSKLCRDATRALARSEVAAEATGGASLEADDAATQVAAEADRLLDLVERAERGGCDCPDCARTRKSIARA